MTPNRPEKKFDRFFGRLDVCEGLAEGAYEDCLEVEGRDISEGGDRGEGQKLEWSGEVGVVETVDPVNPVDAELIDSVSHALLLYESLGSLFGKVVYPEIEDAIISASTWGPTPTVSTLKPLWRNAAGRIERYRVK